MYNALKKSLIQWNKNTGDLAKLQYAYATTALMLLVVSGLFSLINNEAGAYLIAITFGVTVVFFVNVVAWALLDSLVLSKLSKSANTRKR